MTIFPYKREYSHSRQFISTVNMAVNSHEEFISRSTFKKLCLQKKEEERDIKSWVELQMNYRLGWITDGTVYKIINCKKIQGKFGDCYIHSIKNKIWEESKVWAPKKLQKEFNEEANKSIPRSLYFVSLGQTKKQDGSGYLINEYESCYK